MLLCIGSLVCIHYADCVSCFHGCFRSRRSWSFRTPVENGWFANVSPALHQTGVECIFSLHCCCWWQWCVTVGVCVCAGVTGLACFQGEVSPCVLTFLSSWRQGERGAHTLPGGLLDSCTCCGWITVRLRVFELISLCSHSWKLLCLPVFLHRVFFPRAVVGMRALMQRVSADLPALMRMCLFDWKPVRSC